MQTLPLPTLVLTFALAMTSNPAAAPQSTQVIDLGFYGAVPNDGIDDTAQFAAAFAAADAAAGPVRMILYPGTYDLFLTAAPVGFAVDGVNGLEIFGAASEIKLHNFDPAAANGDPAAFPKHLIDVRDCTGVHVKGLRLKLARESYSLGTISSITLDSSGAVDPIHTIVLDLDPAYGDLTDAAVIERLDQYDPALGYPTSNNMTVSFPSAAEYDFDVIGGPPSLQAELSTTVSSSDWFVSRMENAQIGDGIVVMHSKYRCHFLRAIGCDGFTLEDVTLFDGAGMGCILENTTDVLIDNFDMTPHSGRLLSITADSVHARDCRGSFEMRNCNMNRMGDDGLNVYSPFMVVDSGDTGASQTIQVSEMSWYNDQVFAPGEELHIYGPDLAPKAIATIVSFTPVPGSPANPSTYDLVISGATANTAAGDFVTNGANYPDAITVRDCTFSEIMAHGLVLKSQDMTVERCSFTRTVGAGINFKTDVSGWSEGEGARDVLVDNCIFDDVNRYVWSDRGAISFYGDLPGAGLPPFGLHDNVQVQNCEFRNLGNDTGNGKCAIWIASTNYALIGLSNEFKNVDSALSLVRVDRSRDVFIGFNTVDSSYAGTPVTADTESAPTTYEIQNSWN